MKPVSSLRPIGLASIVASASVAFLIGSGSASAAISLGSVVPTWASTSGGPVITFSVSPSTATFTATIGGVPVTVIKNPPGASSPYVVIAPPNPQGPALFVVTNDVDHTTASTTITYIDIPAIGLASSISRVSLASNGAEGTARGNSGVGSFLTHPASEDGRYVAFFSETDLGFGAVSAGRFRSYVKDVVTGALSPLTVGDSCFLTCSESISLDGSKVLFVTDFGTARGAVVTSAPFPNALERVDVNDAGQAAEGNVAAVALAGKGEYAAFITTSNLDGAVGDASSNTADLFVRALATGHTERWTTNANVANVSISGDGRFLAFTTGTALVPEATNTFSDVYVIDRLASTPAAPAYRLLTLSANSFSTTALISSDGSAVAFTSSASNLVSSDTNRAQDVFVAALPSGVITRASLGPGGIQANGGSIVGSISGDGRWVGFASTAANIRAPLPAAMGGLGIQPYVHNMDTLETFLVNASADGTVGNAPVNGEYLTADGSRVVFVSPATNLVPGDANALPDIFMKTLPVGQSPRITSANATTFAVGSAGTFTVMTSGFPTVATITGLGALPAGVTFTDNGNGTATLSGTPAGATAGSYPLTITASNGVSPDATQMFTLTVTLTAVSQPPSITSANTTTFTVGNAGTFTVTTSGVPIVGTIARIGALPAGVTFTDNGNGTATLSGIPAAATGGSYPVTITAGNGVLPNATQSFTLTVNQAPAITSASTVPPDALSPIGGFIIGWFPQIFLVTTSGFPTVAPITEIGELPTGVSFTDNGNGTASLNGTPAAGTAGLYPLTFKASNGVPPDATQVFMLRVTQRPVFTSADAVTFTVGSAGTFTVTTSGSPVATITDLYTALPPWATFTDNGDGTATLTGTPPAASGAIRSVVFLASNGVLDHFSVQSFTLTVNEAPVITSANIATAPIGALGSFTVTTRGFPKPTITVAGTLPLVFHTDCSTEQERMRLDAYTTIPGTAKLSGAPCEGTEGSYPLTITASNGVLPNAVQSFTLIVGPAPPVAVRWRLQDVTYAPNGVPNGGSATGFFTLQYDWTGAKLVDWSITVRGGNETTFPPLTYDPTVGGGPGGFGFDNTQLVLSKTGERGLVFIFGPLPVSGGTFGLAGNFGDEYLGAPTFRGYVITDYLAPTIMITSANTVTFTAGSASTFTVITSGSPAARITKTGALPTGVTFTDNANGTATLSGTPAPATRGSYPLTITASNGAVAEQFFTLTVDATCEADSDLDGLCDEWEEHGVTLDEHNNPVTCTGQFCEVDLPAMGASPTHKDIFVQVDYMVEPSTICVLGVCLDGHTHEPNPDALAAVVQAFADAPVSNPDRQNGIRLHVDCGPTCSALWAGKGGDVGLLDGGPLPFHNNNIGLCHDSASSPGQCVDFNPSEREPDDGTDFDAIKKTYFSLTRSHVFHYAVFAHSLGAAPGVDTSKTYGAALPGPKSKKGEGSDLIISLGYGRGRGSMAQQAADFMHELGHNLGLHHGGPIDDVNGKPNYLSVMNYLYDVVDGGGGLLPSRSEQSLFDYSRFMLPTLDKKLLDENFGLNDRFGSLSPYLDRFYLRYYCADGLHASREILPFPFNSLVPGDKAVNWNCDGAIESQVSANINGETDPNAPSTLHGAEDWHNLVYSGGGIGGFSQGLSLGTATPVLGETIHDAPTPFQVQVAGPGFIGMVSGKSGELVFTVTNSGEQNDTYNIEPSATVTWASLSNVPQVVDLASGASVTISLPVSIPASTGEAEGRFTIKVMSSTTTTILDSAVAVITVSLDTVPPVLELPADVVVEAKDSEGTAVNYVASAIDAVDGIVPVECNPASGSTFLIIITTVHCSTSDQAGNVSSGVFRLVVRDTTPPVIASHADVTTEATSSSGAFADYMSPTTTDIVDGLGRATCTPVSGSPFPLGNTSVICTATDAHGNVAAPTGFKLTVRDTTPPIISGLPANCVLWPPNSKMIQVGVITASDAVSGLAADSLVVTGTSSEPQGLDPDILIRPTSGSGVVVQLRADRLGTGKGRLYTLKATAMDLAGNTASAMTTCAVPHDQGR